MFLEGIPERFFLSAHLNFSVNKREMVFKELCKVYYYF